MMKDVSAKTNGILRNKLSALPWRFRFGSLQDWASVALVFLSLGVAVWSIERARWVNPQPSLILTLGLAVLSATLVVLLRLRTKVAYPLMALLGLLITVWQSSGAIVHSSEESALQAWWQTVSGTVPSESTLYFTMFLILVTWLIGFVSTWFVLKKRNAWVTVVLGSVMILVNLNNLPRDYYYLFPLYAVAILLLIFQVNLAKQSDWFKKHDIRKPFHNVMYLIIAVLCVAVLVVSVAWFVPEPPISQIALKLDTSSLHNANPAKNWLNIFAQIPSKWPWIESKKQGTLLFETALESGENIHFVVTSSQPAYWLTRRYDTYDSWGWTDTSVAGQEVSPGVSVASATSSPHTTSVSYIVENKVKTDVILTTGEFVSADVPVVLKTIPIDQNNSDVLSVVSPWVLGPYQRYTVTDIVPSFTVEELASLKGEYPEWVIARYLQLPDNFPEHVRTLSEDLTKDAVTPYEKLVAIKKYLNKFQYDQKSVAPSGTEDGVALFLYSTKKGNCVSFASSMVVMLRSAGVPARFCTGYLHGDLDRQTGKYIVRSRHYHAWAEVYFPVYGWIEFETTPSGGADSEIGISGDDTSLGYVDELPYWMQGNELYEDTGAVGPVPYKKQTEHWGWIYWVIGGVLVSIVYIIRLMLDSWVNRLKRVKDASEAYTRMCHLASLGKAGPKAQETPLEYAKRLAMILPGEADYINNVTRSYIDARYSPRKEITEEYEKSKLQKSWVVLCISLVRHRLRFRKWALLRLLWQPT